MGGPSGNAPIGLRRNVLIVAATIALLAIVFMYFQGRQRKRELQFRRLEQQMDLLEEWAPPERDEERNNVPGGGKIL